MVLDTALLNTRQYKVLSRVKWSNAEEGVATSPTHRCSSYWKGGLLVTLDFSRQLYNFHWYLILTILFDINPLFGKFKSFKYCYLILTLLFDINHFFGHSQNCFKYKYLLWGHILPYPKDGLVQPKHILRASSLGKITSRFLRDI